ncbi:MAG: MaoC family dehydratase [Dehalococcoidia bacterium]
MTQSVSILEELRKRIGQEMTVTAPEPIDRAFIRYFALANEDLNPLYLDEEYAKNTRYGGIIAPPTFICESVQYLVGELDEEGGAVRRFKIGAPTGMEIRAANDYEFFQPASPGDVITAHWKIVDAYDKNGKTGKLYFLVYDITYTNQRGELLIKNREWLVLRSSSA